MYSEKATKVSFSEYMNFKGGVVFRQAPYTSDSDHESSVAIISLWTIHCTLENSLMHICSQKSSDNKLRGHHKIEWKWYVL